MSHPRLALSVPPVSVSHTGPSQHPDSSSHNAVNPSISTVLSKQAPVPLPLSSRSPLKSRTVPSHQLVPVSLSSITAGSSLKTTTICLDASDDDDDDDDSSNNNNNGNNDTSRQSGPLSSAIFSPRLLRDSIPRQTIIKALASAVRKGNPSEAFLLPSLPGMLTPDSAGSVASAPATTVANGNGDSNSNSEGNSNSNSTSHSTSSSGISSGSSSVSSVSGNGGNSNKNGHFGDNSSVSLALAQPPPPPSQPFLGMHRRARSTGQQIADAIADLSLGRETTPTTAFPTFSAFPALNSPCFYHERLDAALNVDQVLDAVKNDESMSHSRLVQTATSVRQVSKLLQRRPIRRAVRSVMIVTKARDNQLVYLTRELALWLLRTPRYGSDLGVNVYVDAKLRASRRFNAEAVVAENPRFEAMLGYWTPDLCWSRPEMFDLVLTLGGDGTVLFTSWLFQRIVPPVLPFALGSLGFLTSFEFDRYQHHLGRVMGDEGMRVNLRMRFTCTVFRAGAATRARAKGGATTASTTSAASAASAVSAPTEGEGEDMMEEAEQFEVLNELVIDRGPSPYVSNLELYGDDELLTVIQADGCIFSTPTGSTAYSLSAGGSLVHPDIPCILLTPICPHTLSFRPMVLSDTMALRVAVPRDSRATAYCAFDGKGRIELRQGDAVTITASQYPFPTVTRTDTEWFDSVSRTLRWNTRAATQKAFDTSVMVDEATTDDRDAREPEWDIDVDADSACYASEDGSMASSSPLRMMSLLGM